MSDSYHFGLIGSNIGYSRSPAVFDAIFEIDGVDGRFELLDIPHERFDTSFEQLLQSGVSGLAVTIPYKQRVMSFLDELDSAAKALNAVNSIAVGDTCRGFNTDVFGFGEALKARCDTLRDGRALVLGCGGGARAAAYSLAHDFGVKDILLVGRSGESLTICQEGLQEALPHTSIETRSNEELIPNANESFAIVVNATPLGGWNHADASPLPRQFDWSQTGLYYDLNYNDNNRLIAEARARGVTALDGSRMLVTQAVRSYQLWTGREVPIDPVYAGVFNR